jgi:Phage integrase family.
MTQIDLRYVSGRTNKSGKTLYYWHRRGFPLTRLYGDLQSLELAEQATKLNLAADGGGLKPPGAAAQDAEPARKNTIGWLIEDYLASNTFASKAERTQKDYRYYLGQIKEMFGDAPIRDLEPPEGRVFIYRFINRFADKPRKGNHFRALFSVICSHALLINKLKSNPVDGVPQLSTKPRQQFWTFEQEETFLANCDDEMIKLAFMLGAYTAQRQGDLLAMAWNQFDPRENTLALRQRKTGARLLVPVHKALRSWLDRTAQQGLTILTTRTGKPFREDYFRHRWRDAILQAGLDGLRFQDLRRTAVVRLAEAGCTDPEIAAITGHSLERTRQILETYLPRTSEMARNAMAKWESKPGTRV